MRDYSRPTRLKSLKDLVRGLPQARVLRPEVMVSAITDDSRKVVPGALFVAIPGRRVDGHRFVKQALDKGAVALAVAEGRLLEQHIPAGILLPDTRQALGYLAASFYDHPSEYLTLVAVTGTNGKTTLTYLLEQIFSEAGFACGVIGTIEYRGRGFRDVATQTTPGAIELQRLLATFKERGVKFVALEASSHGLEQGRLNGTRVSAAIFTNLSRDHLDYHGHFEAYYAAKKRLFLEHLAGPALINLDDPYGQRLAKELSGPVITFGLQNGDIRGRILKADLSGTHLEIRGAFGKLLLTSPLVGAFQAENLLAAFACGLSLGLEPEVIADALSRASGPPGRLEAIKNPFGFSVLVDYAHTPEALSRVLETLRQMTPGRLLVVFGCGGDRDQGKRPLMGQVAGEKADLVFLTSDNPRSEPPDQILEEIKRGLKRTETPYHLIVSRQEAIYLAINEAEPGDCVLIAGKGHETYQEIAGKRRPFDDRKVARAALAFRAMGQEALKEVAGI
ncbi:UDP-N-acetylmuramoyl-L-alanyl-D-glutamate--2,6-diaminopimelate ligase [Thermosulfuriphilus ammonigenes]|uniref:UDP-N-acetylmuramoyl-L-alanyl-D-glutamate--2,6-diaminopimelate ligase n=1 Tax=Thermosulfuriphilus ammonigenes TaxID=1936021 RepID=A0A6G7PYA3_9BACT|nr:UDP-N-acetylmuramoyl-L-alanyl-D-glutamate--2,6-diaminopimelate ligase [Thermosulfuriphilus ammonigenes]MBA2849431.1 UDP-N-acetylmuramoyl-L-alanyl-D-glutamate--2,6-diaminopimelate ligase [Thermosulfuriphilus ammonigenes]QIJ72501.1 UDP-N-acetylmuramoyl-L-alanyl-D-glutamate--2,6-diaminopimelate ligase [Thermosulfuriphilus ammonigenes]